MSHDILKKNLTALLSTYCENQIKEIANTLGVKIDKMYAYNKAYVIIDDISNIIIDPNTKEVKMDTLNLKLLNQTKNILHDLMFRKEPITNPSILDEKEEYQNDLAVKVEKGEKTFQECLNVVTDHISKIAVAYFSMNEKGKLTKDINIFDCNKFFKDPLYDLYIKTVKADKTPLNEFENTRDGKRDIPINEYRGEINNALEEVYAIETEDRNTMIEEAFSSVTSPIVEQKNTNGNEYRMEKAIEKLCVSYHSLREKYQKSSFFHKYFTIDGWKESNTINKTRRKLMELGYYQNKDNFHNEVEKIATKTKYSEFDRDNLKKNLEVKAYKPELLKEEFVQVAKDMLKELNKIDEVFKETNQKENNIIYNNQEQILDNEIQFKK